MTILCLHAKVVALDIPQACDILSEAVYNFSLNFTTGRLPNLGVNHHFEVNENSVTSKHPTQSWQTFIPVLPTFTGTISTHWSSEAVIY